MLTVGIDIGTTSLSAAVADSVRRKVLSTKTVPNDSFLAAYDYWEKIQDPQRIVRKAREMLDGYLDTYPEIQAIGLTGQMHGIVYLDADGNAVSPLYTWQDERGNLPGSDGKSLAARIREQIGLFAASGFGLVTHIYQNENGLVPEEAVSLCTIPDYLGVVLTGRKKALLHASMAASLGFFDTEKRDFDREPYHQMAGGGEAWLPEFSNRMKILGSYRGIPVVTAIGDNQASFLGSVGLQEGVLQVNIGTGSQICMLSHICFETEGIEARPLTEDTWILTGAALCGGRAWAIFERFFRSCLEAAGVEAGPQYEVLERLARTELDECRSAGKQQPVVDPRFQGTRMDPMLRGSITQLSEETFTPGCLAYGVLQGIAQELYDLYRLIPAGSDSHVQRIIASGNAVRKSKVLQEIVSGTFHAPLELSEYQEEAACGAAFAAADCV